MHFTLQKNEKKIAQNKFKKKQFIAGWTFECVDEMSLECIIYGSAWCVCGIQKKIRRRKKNHALIGPMKLVFGIIKVKFDKYLHKSTVARPTLNDSSRKCKHCRLRWNALPRMSQASSWFNAIDYFCRSFNRSLVHSFVYSFVRSFAASPFSQPFPTEFFSIYFFVLCCLFIVYILNYRVFNVHSSI